MRVYAVIVVLGFWGLLGFWMLIEIGEIFRE